MARSRYEVEVAVAIIVKVASSYCPSAKGSGVKPLEGMLGVNGVDGGDATPVGWERIEQGSGFVCLGRRLELL